MELFLGIDGGGTKTAALLMDASGGVLGRGEGGSGNIATNNDAILASSVRKAVAEACFEASLEPGTCEFAAVCAGVAGYSVEERRPAFLAILRAQIRALAYNVQPDYAVAYWGASHGAPGIVVIAGTGAVAFGRNEAGETSTEDGLGYLLGDRGSGFNLGIRVLRHTLTRMQEGRSDILSEAVLAHTGAQNQNDILQWLYGQFSPARVASLAPIVGELAESGDPIARMHIVEMARRLRHTVRQVRHKLWLPRDTPVYTLGGLWQLGAFFRSEFQEPHWRGEGEITIEEEALPGGHFNITPPRSDAAYGAALMAKQESEQRHG
jgi:N-acetylglucosamine kinase-like BadF-type ATPase